MENANFVALNSYELMNVEGGVKWYWWAISPGCTALYCVGRLGRHLYRLGYSNGYNSTRR